MSAVVVLQELLQLTEPLLEAVLDEPVDVWLRLLLLLVVALGEALAVEDEASFGDEVVNGGVDLFAVPLVSLARRKQPELRGQVAADDRRLRQAEIAYRTKQISGNYISG